MASGAAAAKRAVMRRAFKSWVAVQRLASAKLRIVNAMRCEVLACCVLSQGRVPETACFFVVFCVCVCCAI